MSVSMLENPDGDFCYYNGQKVSYSSLEGQALLQPIPDIVYYESIRIQDGILLFFENHMVRLLKSIESKENFPLDTNILYDLAMKMINKAEPPVVNGNLRIVVTRSTSLIYFSKVSYPDEENFKEGVPTLILPWERLEPHIKVFRDEYKRAVAAKMSQSSPWGPPYELLLVDHQGYITEGSRSNFFVLHNNTVYSPPDALILIGITRRYVLNAIAQAGLLYEEKLFTFEELCQLRDASKDGQNNMAVFITSSPFDILPISSIEDQKFASSQNQNLKKISDFYEIIVEHYIQMRTENTQVEY